MIGVNAKGMGFEPSCNSAPYMNLYQEFKAPSMLPSELRVKTSVPQRECLVNPLVTRGSRQITRLSPYNTATLTGYKVVNYKNPAIISLEISSKIFENFSSLFFSSMIILEDPEKSASGFSCCFSLSLSITSHLMFVDGEIVI